jgi:SAM-dependent methyltransferase
VPPSLASLKGAHNRDTVLVCGCGKSLNLLTYPTGFVTIGVNDVGRRFHPDYLVVVNPAAQFAPDRLAHFRRTQARFVFTQYGDLPVPSERTVRFALGTYNGTDFSNPNVLHYTQNSPYVAMCLAIHMGATRIGVIGVDFTDDHFFGATGQHPLTPRLAQIDREYKKLAAACEGMGIEVYNLSPISRLTAFRRATLEEFSHMASEHPLAVSETGWLRIVSYATTPVAGVPPILARCIGARTAHRSRCVWAESSYGNGVSFDGDIEWTERPAEAEAALAEADIVIVHNGKIDRKHAPLIRGKPVVTMAHNYLWNVDQTLVQQGFPGVVIGQYQATLPEFAGWALVPNPIPFWEAAFRPEVKGDNVTIAYTPSGRHESYPEGHRLYWHGKGYATTMRVLESLSRRFPIRIEAVQDRQLSHAEALAAKRRAHIVIDECVTGSYHRNSLEGLACGSVVVNGVGLRDGVVDAFRRCAGGAADVPFVLASGDTLEAVLAGLVESGSAALAAAGQRNRAWLEAHWDFARQWPQFWQPVIERAAERNGRLGGSAMSVQRVSRSLHVDATRPPLSIVIPHRGADRLPQLRQTLVTLAAQRPEDEIIVAELGPSPLAADIVREVDGIHVLVAATDVFERARALNAGSAIASHDLVVWQDNDLVAGPLFYSQAAAELETRGLDYLIPYTQISYLSAADTDAVLRGAIALDQCRPVRILRSGRDVSGGMGIVRRRFLDQFGGFSQEFRGWGGEDNFWWWKATLLGRAGTSQRADQQLWHLFHDHCGALTGRLPLDSPHYHRNVALLVEARRLNSPAQFRARFPWQRRDYCPFDATAHLRFLAVAGTPWADLAAEVKTVLEGLYGLPITLDDASLAGDGHECAASVTFGSDAFACWTNSAALGSRPALHHAARTDEIQHLTQAGLACLAHSIIVDAPPQHVAAAGIDRPAFSWAGRRSTGTEARRIAVALVQALSNAPHALGATAENPATPSAARDAAPIWLYWEGDLPDWIERCHASIFAHAPGARLLDRSEFELIWDRDRDIDIGRLRPAQRADFIRAFLLWRHGGIWIDSDCLLMGSLEEVQRLLERHDFIAHRDRQGLFPNGFMAAAPQSRVAAELYRRICERLRSRRPLGWISLGGEPLTHILRTITANWHELPCERIQPVCWSEPQRFFAVAEAAVHEARFDQRAITYMLSHTKVAEYQRQSPGSDLLAEGTFFRFLLARSIGSPALDRSARRLPDGASENLDVFGKYHRAALLRRDESLSGPGSSTSQTATLRRVLPDVLRTLGVQSLLDAGCGDFNWMRHIDLALNRYIGVDIVEDLIARNRQRHGSGVREFLCLDLASADLPRADAVLCRDTLAHYSLAGARAILRNLARSSARYLLATSFPGRGANADIPIGGWRPLDMQAAPFDFPPPLRVVLENCTEMGGQYADKSVGVWELQRLAL